MTSGSNVAGDSRSCVAYRRPRPRRRSRSHGRSSSQAALFLCRVLTTGDAGEIADERARARPDAQPTRTSFQTHSKVRSRSSCLARAARIPRALEQTVVLLKGTLVVGVAN